MIWVLGPLGEHVPCIIAKDDDLILQALPGDPRPLTASSISTCTQGLGLGNGTESGNCSNGHATGITIGVTCRIAVPCFTGDFCIGVAVTAPAIRFGCHSKELLPELPKHHGYHQ